MTTFRGTIALDFDGVLHQYVSPWEGAEVIADPPVDGAQAFCQRLLRDGWKVVVASTRCDSEAGRGAIAGWLTKYSFPLSVGIAESGKPPAKVYLDDRALRFDGEWPDDDALVRAARPWNDDMKTRR